MSRIIVIIVLLATVAPHGAAGQASESEDFRVTEWRGGNLEADLRLGLNLSGPGLATGTFGGVLSARLPGSAASLFVNPARLARIRSSEFLIESRARFANGSLGLGDRSLFTDASITESTDEMLLDLDFPESSSPTYTTTGDIRAGQPGQLAAVAVAVPLNERLTIAFGYAQPLEASIDLRSAGLEVMLDAGRESGTQTIDIDLLGQLSIGGRFAAQLDVLGLALAGRLGDDEFGGFEWGASILRYEGLLAMNWVVRPEAMVVLSNAEQYFFNDPDDRNLGPGETNRLDWTARARYRGGAWGGRAGLAFRTSDDAVGISLVINGAYPLRLNDPNAFAESYLPIFVNLSGEADPEPYEDALLDVDRLELARPNKTVATSDSIGTQMTLRMPVTATVGLDIGMRDQTLTLNYLRYEGEMSVSGNYGGRGRGGNPFRIGKRLTHGVRAGLDLRFPDRMTGAAWLLLPIRLLFLDFDGLLFQALGDAVGYRDAHYRIGGGVVWGDAIVDDVERNVREDFRSVLEGMVPSSLVLGRQYTLLDRINVGVTLFGVPDLTLRVGLAYRMP